MTYMTELRYLWKRYLEIILDYKLITHKRWELRVEELPTLFAVFKYNTSLSYA